MNSRVSSSGVAVNTEAASVSDSTSATEMVVDETDKTEGETQTNSSAESSSIRKRPYRFMKRNYRPRAANTNSPSSSEDEQDADWRPNDPVTDDNAADSNLDGDNLNRILPDIPEGVAPLVINHFFFILSFFHFT